MLIELAKRMAVTIQKVKVRKPCCHVIPDRATAVDLRPDTRRSRMKRQLRGKPSNNARPPSEMYAARQPDRLMMDWATTGKIMAPKPAPTITKANAIPRRR